MHAEPRREGVAEILLATLAARLRMSKKVAMSSIERGCFLIADVSGYTRYLGGVELDHAHDILAGMLGAVVTNTRIMKTAKLEGDAVFCHAATSDLDGVSSSTLSRAATLPSLSGDARSLISPPACAMRAKSWTCST